MLTWDLRYVPLSTRLLIIFCSVFWSKLSCSPGWMGLLLGFVPKQQYWVGIHWSVKISLRVARNNGKKWKWRDRNQRKSSPHGDQPCKQQWAVPGLLVWEHWYMSYKQVSKSEIPGLHTISWAAHSSEPWRFIILVAPFFPRSRGKGKTSSLPLSSPSKRPERCSCRSVCKGKTPIMT